MKIQGHPQCKRFSYMKPYKIKVKQAHRQDQVLCLSLKMKENLLKKDISAKQIIFLWFAG